MNRRMFLGLDRPSSQSMYSLPQEIQPPKPQPWGIAEINHLYHRLGFSATLDDIKRCLGKSPTEVIDMLMDDSLITDLMPDPPPYSDAWIHTPPYTGPEYSIAHAEDVLQHTTKMDLRMWFTCLMMDSSSQLREKLTLFWHNHFVIEEVKLYFGLHIYRYFQYLRANAWGNFKQMVKDITIMPAMLKYLDGLWSEKDMINENYARELLELFTLGITDRDGNKNYTQEDIRNLAFAVTGWRFRYEEPPPDVMPPYFADYYFDFETKRSIFGSEPKIVGLFAANDSRIEVDAIELLFERRAPAIAWHIAEKVYKNFVYMGDRQPQDDDLIQSLADTLLESDWELKPMFRKLFTSEQFFDPVHRGGAIKSPYEFMMGLFRKLTIPISFFQAGSLCWYGADTGQWLDSPTNVKGWAGYRTWLNTATLPKRLHDIISELVLGRNIEGKVINPHDGFYFPGVPFSDEQVITWAKQFDSYTADLMTLVADMNDFLLALPLSPRRLNEIIKQAGLQHLYEWQTLDDTSRVQPIRRLLYEFLSAPEFQLA